MVICKPAGVGGEVPPHQDSEFLYTRPTSAVGFWYALEDAKGGNGALEFVRGSQGRGVGRRFVRVEGGGTGFVEWEGGQKEVGEDEWEMVEVERGGLVLIHGGVVHRSEANRSGRSRFIYTFHVSFPWGWGGGNGRGY